jgi:hypothetical protein
MLNFPLDYYQMEFYLDLYMLLDKLKKINKYLLKKSLGYNLNIYQIFSNLKNHLLLIVLLIKIIMKFSQLNLKSHNNLIIHFISKHLILISNSIQNNKIFNQLLIFSKK